ncbi:MAG: hypothetical protein JNL08_18510 [Planctomycetes bacterium]|nr:hypothetical protein [Planctomycetota bacterium]
MVWTDGDGFDAPLLEGVVWGLAAAGAIVRCRRAPAPVRPGWLLIAAALLLIVVDKAFDVHALAHAVGAWCAAALDPEHHLRGPNAAYRHVALALGAVGAVGAAAWWLRRDASFGRGKVLCCAGLGLVVALLAARLAPGLEAFLPDWITKAVELAAWLLVVTGLRRGDDGAAPGRPPGGVVDGFV